MVTVDSQLCAPLETGSICMGLDVLDDFRLVPSTIIGKYKKKALFSCLVSYW